MGATGAGKSTLLYLMARFENPDSGQIRLGGLAVADIAEADLRRSICITDQHAHIFNGTLRDNLLIAAPHAEEIDLIEALTVVGLWTFV